MNATLHTLMETFVTVSVQSEIAVRISFFEDKLKLCFLKTLYSQILLMETELEVLTETCFFLLLIETQL